MANNRIKLDNIEAFPLPPMTWYIKKASFLLKQPMVLQNLEQSVAINEPLLESIKKEGVINPLLTCSTFWPLVGSQRLRAILEIRKEDKDFDPYIKFAKIDNSYENFWFLWPEKEFRSKALAANYQLWELIFKSLYFGETKTKDGTDMRYFETIGDQLTGWKYTKLNEGN